MVFYVGVLSTVEVINKIVHDSKEVTDFKIIAEHFLTTTFLLLWRNMSLTVISNNIHLFQQNLNNMSPNKTYFEFPQISLEFIIKYLNTMPVKKGTGLDDIQALFSKKQCRLNVGPLTCNKSALA